MTDPHTANEFRTDLERALLEHLGEKLTMAVVVDLASAFVRKMLTRYRVQFLSEITSEMDRRTGKRK